MKKQKIIFLDIDGVMNNKYDNTSYYCLNPETYGISNDNLKSLDYLISLTDAKIVISSAWIKHDFEYSYKFNDLLFKSPLKQLMNMINDYLYDFNDGLCPILSRTNKRQNILGFFYLMKYVKNMTMDNFNYVILDDSRNQGLEFFDSRFYCIDLNYGLTNNDAESMSLILNKEY